MGLYFFKTIYNVKASPNNIWARSVNNSRTIQNAIDTDNKKIKFQFQFV